VGVVHESHVRDTPEQLAKDTERLTPSQRHDPAKMRVPAYYPDVPAVRRDLANFYDLMTAADYQVGDVMDWLDRYHLADRTVVWVFGDHGTGLPRMKRWLYDSGLRTDLVIRWPGQIAPGTGRDAPVAFVDFAPTVLSIAGAPIPKSVEGQVFLGPNRAKDRDVVFGARDRFDNADDRIRSARDSRYEYIRNYHPELPYSQPMPYAEAGNTMKAWRTLAEAGRLEGAPALFFAAVKPPQELYDTQTDPDEVNNLAGDPRYAAIMARLSDALDRWMKQTGDLENVTTDETASAASNRGQLVVSRKRVH
jgi:arylsulfatase A-like enzyme